MSDKPDTQQKSPTASVFSEDVLKLYMNENSLKACANALEVKLDKHDMANAHISKQKIADDEVTNFGNGVVATRHANGTIDVDAKGARRVEFSNGDTALIGKNGKPLAILEGDSRLFVLSDGKTIEEYKNGDLYKDSSNCNVGKELVELPKLQITYDSANPAGGHAQTVNERSAKILSTLTSVCEKSESNNDPLCGIDLDDPTPRTKDNPTGSRY